MYNVLLSFVSKQECEYDYVEVTGGAGYNKPYGRFCGRELPDAITSDSNSLQVKFNSDDSVQSTGFQAEYFIGTQNQNDFKKIKKNSNM